VSADRHFAFNVRRSPFKVRGSPFTGHSQNIGNTFGSIPGVTFLFFKVTFFWVVWCLFFLEAFDLALKG
jgi:hypothetical protein